MNGRLWQKAMKVSNAAGQLFHPWWVQYADAQLPSHANTAPRTGPGPRTGTPAVGVIEKGVQQEVW